MMKKLLLFFALFAVFTLSSCASPYIGGYVSPTSPAVCDFSSLPMSCTWTTTDFVLEYEIEATGQPNEYKIFGTARAVEGTDKSFTEYTQAEFLLFLIKNNHVVDSFSIAGGRGSLGQTINFSRTFKYEGYFDSTVLGYGMQVQG